MQHLSLGFTGYDGAALNNLRVAVTGAGGRLAKLLIPALSGVCREVIPISRRGGGGAMTWEDALNGGLNNVDTLVHAAWSSVPLTSQLACGPDGSSDIQLCLRMMDCEAVHRLRQIIFFSSASVYGATEGALVGETHPPNPRSHYAITKAGVEKLLEERGRQAGWQPCVLRITNPFGFSYDPARPQGFIARAMDCINNNKPLEIWGDGTIPKDYLHISDLSAALHSAMARNLKGIFNVSSGTSHATLEIISRIEAVTGRKVAVQFCNAYEWDSGMGTIVHTKLSEATGWKPTKTIMEGLRDANTSTFSNTRR